MPPGFCLPKKERLLKQQQFKIVFRNGRRLRHKDRLLVFCENKLNINRIGFIVPKDALKLSTERNRIKRLLREAYRLNKAKLKTGFDIILCAYKPIVSFLDAAKILLNTLKEAKIFK